MWLQVVFIGAEMWDGVLPSLKYKMLGLQTAMVICGVVDEQGYGRAQGSLPPPRTSCGSPGPGGSERRGIWEGEKSMQSSPVCRVGLRTLMVQMGNFSRLWEWGRLV